MTARLAAELSRLWPEGGRLGIAVSGGPDSLALLILAAAALPSMIEAATVDHGLRPESADEAEAVASICRQMGVPHAILRTCVGPGNLQAEARHARYAALAKWMQARDLGALATAHHLDDQVETLVMRLNRGSGVGGLAAIRARGRVPGTDLPLLRPLLAVGRDELGDVVQAAGLVAAQDPSNRSQRFDRVRLRAQLASADWLDHDAIGRSAACLADTDAALDWAAGRAWDEAVAADPAQLSLPLDLPKAVSLRLLTRAYAHFALPQPRGSDLARMYDRLAAGETATLGGLQARPGQGRQRGRWLICHEAPRRS